MTQVKPFDWYEQGMSPGFAGMKANTSLDVCDSFAAESGIDPGEVVIRGTSPGQQIKAASVSGDGAKAIGIALHVHKEPVSSGKYYVSGESVSVMSFGDVYVAAGGDVVAGGAVALAISDGAAKFVASGTASSEAVSGMTYMQSGADGDIVRVRVRK